MDRLSLCPTSLAQWRALVQDAEKASGKLLAGELESYLVLLLQRFTTKPEIASSVLALDYLESQIVKGIRRQEQLQDLGDKCLLFSGLFPACAIRRNVELSYFVHLGQEAYHSLATLMQNKTSIAELYSALDSHFIYLMDTLQCMRELAGKEFGISPLQAEELWRSTGSPHAFEVLRRNVNEIPVTIKTNKFQ